MVRYLSVINFTVQGIQGIHQSTARAHAFRSQVEKAGGRILSQYWTVGDADGFFVFEAPDDQIAMKLLIQLERHGNVRTKSLRAFDEVEFAQISSQA